MKVVYLSPGNLPSRWAHTFQVVEMAAAMAELVDLELVTARTRLPSRVNRIDVHDWYAVSRALRIVSLPVHWYWRGECFTYDTSARYDRAAARHARAQRPDLVYSRSIGAAQRCAARGLATVVETHITASHPQFARLRAAAGLPSLRALVTVTHALRDEWIGGGVPAEKIAVWPDAVDLERFARAPEPAAARAALGLREGPLAVYCGHFYEHKGVSCLVDAARRLPKVAIELVGGWPRDIARLRERARGCETIRFAGFAPHGRVPDYLAAADVLLLPNSARFPQARTASPLKLFEYMAARRPIVATRIPALAAVLRHGENAWLVAPDDPEALADGIEHVLASPGLASRLADQAWRDVQGYTWARRASELLAPFGAPPPR
jgi:glycosyltransferase involved in cell wall biosynthesis